MNTAGSLRKMTFLGGILFLLSFGVFAYAEGLPNASTIVLPGEAPLEGTVVVADEALETYAISGQSNQTGVYGVTMPVPPVVFVSGDDQVPTVTDGIAFVRVSSENGDVGRGDLLVTASELGVARRAADEDEHVFAVALESDTDANGLVQADISTTRAQALRIQREEQRAAALLEAEGGPEEESTFSWVRALIATVVVVGGLFFVLYSFRSTIAHGVVSVGRNPRAKRSIMTLSVANIVFALLLCGVVIFIGIAILVLPL